jgi:predicted small secreted protein
MKLHLIAGLALASLSLAGCGTLQLTGKPAADAKATVANLSAVNSNLGAINQQLITAVLLACGSDVDVSIGFPAPVPSGKLDTKCHIAPGQLKLENGQIVAATPPGTLGLSSAAVGTDVKP